MVYFLTTGLRKEPNLQEGSQTEDFCVLSLSVSPSPNFNRQLAPIPPQILGQMRVQEFVGYAPKPPDLKRNQVDMQQIAYNHHMTVM